MLPRRQQPLVDPWRPHRTALDYLREFNALVHSFGGENVIIGAPYSVAYGVERAIEHFGDEFTTVLDARHWDFARLRSRHEDIAKPRIDVWVRINRRDHLGMFWEPTGARLSLGEGTDFPLWGRHHRLNDFTLPAQRPHNELLYLREVGNLRVNPNTPDTRQAGARLAMYACKALVDRVVEFLGLFCEVHPLTTIDFVLDDDGHMTDWHIVDVEERWLEALETRFAMPAVEFCCLLRTYKSEYELAKRLRDQGISIEAGGVRRLRSELEFHGNRPRFRDQHPMLFHDGDSPRLKSKVFAFPTGARVISDTGRKSEAVRPASQAAIPTKPPANVQKPRLRVSPRARLVDRIAANEFKNKSTNDHKRSSSIPQLVTLKTWHAARFPNQHFDSKTVRLWVSEGKIQPAPVKMKNGLFVDPNATLVE